MNDLGYGVFGFGIIITIILGIIGMIGYLYLTAFFVTSVLGVTWWSITFYLCSIGVLGTLGALTSKVIRKSD